MTKLTIATTVVGGITLLVVLYNAYNDWQQETGMKKYLGLILLLLFLATAALAYYVMREQGECSCVDSSSQTDDATHTRTKKPSKTTTSKDTKIRAGGGGIMAALYAA